MADQVLDDLTALLPPLLRALEGLGFIQRYMDPPRLPRVLQAVGEPEVELAEARPRLDAWPEPLTQVRDRLASVSDGVMSAYGALREATAGESYDLRDVMRAIRPLARVQEALYPLAAGLPPINRYFMTPAARDDKDLMERLAAEPTHTEVGVFHEGGEPGGRGTWSSYAPEYYTAERAWPLVVALHGGSGNGRAFLWSWLRDARSLGAILISPTAVGDTWALNGHDVDTPNLMAILEVAMGRWNIDETRVLLTGMSDGGTFSYVSGLQASPFTHLAPASASFHPMLAAMADPDRVRGLPIHITHGALDWMFPVEMARQARDSLADAGAEVTYRELPDLAHTYAREVNPDVLAWLAAR
ncbi:MAG TPA: dienelactone hydrolase family protein [Caulobacteraceae bacterium]|nr:dienelactone hydrolase family protein [Caulobacteraceae bacterium]